MSIPAFGTRPTSNPIGLSGQSDVLIQNLFFNNFVSGQEMIELDSCNNVTITDCDFDTMPSTASGRRGIYLLSCTGSLTIQRCRFKNPAHNAIQLNQTHMNGVISDLRIRGTTTNTEDMISIFQSGGLDHTERLAIYNVFADGTVPGTSAVGWTSSSGSLILLGDSAQDSNTGFIDCYKCSGLNPGAVGIGIAGGNDINLGYCQLWSDQLTNSNVGIYIWKQSALVCSAIDVGKNRVKWTNSSGSDNGVYNNGNCGTLPHYSTNTFSDSTLSSSTLAGYAANNFAL